MKGCSAITHDLCVELAPFLFVIPFIPLNPVVHSFRRVTFVSFHLLCRMKGMLRDHCDLCATLAPFLFVIPFIPFIPVIFFLQ